MPDRPDQLTDRLRHSAVDDAQGIGFGVVMAAFGMHILTHMGFVTGQTTGLAVLIAHLTGLPFPAVYFTVTLPFLGLAWRRMGARFALKTLVTTAALSGLVAVLPSWVELGRIEPTVAAIELQDRTGFPAGHAQLLSDVVIFGLAALIMPLDTLAYSFLGAAVFSLFLAVNHRRDRYVAV